MSIYITTQEAESALYVMDRIKNTVQAVLKTEAVLNGGNIKNVLAIVGYNKRNAELQFIYTSLDSNGPKIDTLYLHNIVYNSKNMDRTQILEEFLEMEP